MNLYRIILQALYRHARPAQTCTCHPTAAVALTINHIAAVALPAALGYLWVTSEASVFVLAAILASMSLVLALMIPRHPAPGRETIFSRPDTQKH